MRPETDRRRDAIGRCCFAVQTPAFPFLAGGKAVAGRGAKRQRIAKGVTGLPGAPFAVLRTSRRAYPSPQEGKSEGQGRRQDGDR